MARRLLQQMARYPRPGRVKTRLQVAMSAAEACAVHEELLCLTTEALLDAGLGPVELWLDCLEPHPTVSGLIRSGVSGPYLQSPGDLGERMYAALASGLSRAEQVVLVGSDCPLLTRDYLGRAFAALEQADVVFGPAEDGGYVLLGCRRLRPGMFEAVQWGSDSVLHRNIEALEARGLSHASLDTLWDIDTPADLQRWRLLSRLGQAGAGGE